MMEIVKIVHTSYILSLAQLLAASDTFFMKAKRRGLCAVVRS